MRGYPLRRLLAYTLRARRPTRLRSRAPCRSLATRDAAYEDTLASPASGPASCPSAYGSVRAVLLPLFGSTLRNSRPMFARRRRATLGPLTAAPEDGNDGVKPVWRVGWGSA